MKKSAVSFVSSLVVVFGLASTAYADTDYVVKKGDTLQKIAVANGTTIQSILRKNNINDPNYITVGEHLTIPTSDSVSTASTKSKASAIVATAKSMLGKYHYVWGGAKPSDGGFDCSGFVKYVYAKNGIKLPRIASDQAKVGRFVKPSHAQKGDLVFFVNTYKNNYSNRVTHVGIYIGNGKMIVESSAKNNIVITKIWGNPYWEKHFYGIKRVIH